MIIIFILSNISTSCTNNTSFKICRSKDVSKNGHVGVLLLRVMSIHPTPYLRMGVSSLEVGVDLVVGLHNVVGDTINNASRQPTKESPHGNIRNGHLGPNVESSRPILLHDLLQGCQVFGKSHLRNHLPRLHLLVRVLHPHGGPNCYRDIRGSVDEFVNLGSGKVVIPGVEPAHLPAVPGYRPRLSHNLSVHLQGGKLAKWSLAVRNTSSPVLTALESHVLKGNLSQVQCQPGDLCPPEGHVSVVDLDGRHGVSLLFLSLLLPMVQCSASGSPH